MYLSVRLQQNLEYLASDLSDINGTNDCHKCFASNSYLTFWIGIPQKSVADIFYPDGCTNKPLTNLHTHWKLHQQSRSHLPSFHEKEWNFRNAYILHQSQAALKVKATTSTFIIAVKKIPIFGLRKDSPRPLRIYVLLVLFWFRHSRCLSRDNKTIWWFYHQSRIQSLTRETFYWLFD